MLLEFRVLFANDCFWMVNDSFVLVSPSCLGSLGSFLLMIASGLETTPLCW